jgi:AhpD family alkylhydroperoxidase
MPHIPPVDASDLPQLHPVFAGAKAAMGFVPDSLRTMAHIPQLPAAFSLLATVAFGGDMRGPLATLAADTPPPLADNERLPASLVQLIAYATSVSAGCRYCQAHTAHNAVRYGTETAKLDHILDYAESSLFSASERAALDLAFAAGRVPNETEAAHFEILEAHFSKVQVAQIVSVVALFGFLNRWNDTMATSLEPIPRAFADDALRRMGWTAGKHTSGGSPESST